MIAIDEEYNKDYKEALYKAQTENELEPLVKVFKNCQNRLNEKLEDYMQIIEEVSKEFD